MKRRIAVWAGVGFVVASCWILYTLITPPEVLNVTLRQPWVEALAVMSCPVVTLAGRYLRLGLSFWAVAVMNAATYALIGLMMQTVRRTLNLSRAG